jgi:uncharacterized protein (TIGR03435 family)
MMHHVLWSEAWTAALVNHLWQSTLFVPIAWVVTLILRNNQARTRYWIWMIASAKFLIPFSILINAGEFLQAFLVSRIQSSTWTAAMAQIVQPFPQTPSTDITFFYDKGLASATSAESSLSIILSAAWLCGFLAVIVWWARTWIRIWLAVRSSPRIGMLEKVPIHISSQILEPSVFGVFRPELLLPEVIKNRLPDSQLNAIVSHEMCHIRRRDNLSAAIHMIVQAAFWFHPVVWWIKSRLMDERERACDEAVLQSGTEAQLYAESILSVCKYCVESPLACASGISGSDLKQRIVRIMTNKIVRKLDFSRKLLLSISVIAVLALPLVLGLAQSPAFEVASVKLSADQQRQREATGNPPPIARGKQGGIIYTHVTLIGVLARAYSVAPSEIVGPSWLREKFYDIVAKAPEGASAEQVPEMLQNLLALRFGLRVHWDTQQKDGYALVQGNKNLKLMRSVSNPEGAINRRESISIRSGGPTQLGFNETTLEDFANSLTIILGSPVANMTKIQGAYDINIECASESLVGVPAALKQTTVSENSDAGPSIFSAIRELGLDLVSRKLPVKRLVVDSIEVVPTAN